MIAAKNGAVKMRAFRAILALALVAGLAACGDRPESKFRTYDGPEVTQLLVKKAERKLYLLNDATALKVYDIALGPEPAGHKRFEGDMRTPEGLYRIDRRNPQSAFHLSIGISYPNEEDRAYASTKGKDPGGDIFIHGQAGRNVGRPWDWTEGCIAVTDEEIEEIYAMVENGTPILILP